MGELNIQTIPPLAAALLPHLPQQPQPPALWGPASSSSITPPNLQPQSHLSVRRFSILKDPLPWSVCPLNGNHTGYDEECEKASSTQYFWYRKTLNISPSIQENGGVQWEPALCLLLAWLMVYLCILRGTESTGKVGQGAPRVQCSLREVAREQWPVPGAASAVLGGSWLGPGTLTGLLAQTIE